MDIKIVNVNSFLSMEIIEWVKMHLCIYVQLITLPNVETFETNIQRFSINLDVIIDAFNYLNLIN